jgi:hypothetical protein
MAGFEMLGAILAAVERDRPNVTVVATELFSAAYYDHIIAAFEQAGSEPRVTAFTAPPPQAMLARLHAGREFGLPPASFANAAAVARPDLTARRIEPEILAQWSILSAARSQSVAIARFLDSARRCAEENGWLLPTNEAFRSQRCSGGAIR